MALQTAVLPGRNAIFILKGTVKAGVILEACLSGNFFQKDAFFNQNLGGNQPSLGHITVETDAHGLLKQMADGTAADKKSFCKGIDIFFYKIYIQYISCCCSSVGRAMD